MKYTVHINEYTFYSIVVEAKDRKEAGDIATEMFLNGELDILDENIELDVYDNEEE